MASVALCAGGVLPPFVALGPSFRPAGLEDSAFQRPGGPSAFPGLRPGVLLFASLRSVRPHVPWRFSLVGGAPTRSSLFGGVPAAIRSFGFLPGGAALRLVVPCCFSASRWRRALFALRLSPPVRPSLGSRRPPGPGSSASMPPAPGSRVTGTWCFCLWITSEKPKTAPSKSRLFHIPLTSFPQVTNKLSTAVLSFSSSLGVY